MASYRIELMGGDSPKSDPSVPSDEGEDGELRLLKAALSGIKLERSQTNTPPADQGYRRCGYRLLGDPKRQQIRHFPDFAADLACGVDGPALRQAYPDLWVVDLPLWQKLADSNASQTELAKSWRDSPGRDLLRDMMKLTDLGNRGLGGLAASAGAGPEMQPQERRGQQGWWQLHTAIPGPSQAAWEPEEPVVPTALMLLEEGSPVSLRGAALGWLLDRAVDEPIYEVGGIRRDLRQELPMRLAEAFNRDDTQVCTDLETVVLRHAERICADNQSPGPVSRCWGIARWLQGCLQRSPFYGADAETMASKLLALLPVEPILDHPDPLHPGRFRSDGSGLNIHELSVLGGTLRHYMRAGRTWALTPLPLVDELRRIADRILNFGEQQAEDQLAKGKSELGWNAPHVAPPLLARWLMTHLHIDFLQDLSPASRTELLTRFTDDAERHAWVPFAIANEGHKLEREFRLEAAQAWRCHARARRPSAEATALMAAGVLDIIEENSDEEELALQLGREAPASWRPFVLDSLAESAERWHRDRFWEAAMHSLQSVMSDKKIEDSIRQNAALLGVRRAAQREDRTVLSNYLQIVANPPFADHPGMRRELRRLGLSAKGSLGGSGR